MSSIDLLISKSLTSKIKSNLDSDTEKKLKMKLFEKYGMSIKQSIEDFSKLDKILKEFLDYGTLQFEQNCLFEIIKLNKSKDDSWILTIKDINLIELLLKLLGDKESRKIMEQTSKKPTVIPDILYVCKLSTTSGYRKINSLIRDGFLIKSGHKMINKRAVDKFVMFCDRMDIKMEKDKYTVKVKVSNKIIENSTVIKTIMN